MRFVSFAVLVCLLVIVGCTPVAKKENAESHYKLGISYMGTGDPTTALREFLLAEEVEPDNAELQAAR